MNVLSITKFNLAIFSFIKKKILTKTILAIYNIINYIIEL